MVVADEDDDDVKVPDVSATQRRVYALPTETVERIVEYQKEKGFQSEVEAVRRLLDEALKSRDTPTKIINRFLSRLEQHRVATEAAREVLMGHPMIEGIRFTRESVSFTIKNVPEVTITDDGRVTFDWAGSGFDMWKWERNKSNKYAPGIIDQGDVPF